MRRYFVARAGAMSEIGGGVWALLMLGCAGMLIAVPIVRAVTSSDGRFLVPALAWILLSLAAFGAWALASLVLLVGHDAGATTGVQRIGLGLLFAGPILYLFVAYRMIRGAVANVPKDSESQANSEPS